REIPVIADSYPDPEKGTGAVKITPAHDPNDFEVGERAGLDSVVCIGFDAKMTETAGKYAGLDRFECRKAWVRELDEAGYLVKTEPVVIPTGRCYRCDSVVEPMLSDQWFVRMKELAAPAREVAEDGRLVHVPARFEKTYLHWLEDIRDWCISRQLWWGHRIPAWYCGDCGEIIVARTEPDACPKCGGAKLTQDEDVLDTWFSSALWPFSTLGWPDETPDLKYFYPTSVLVTGYDIIFFWVVRMVFSALECMGEVPFSHVFVHGLVRDSDGRKMSKSLNNGVDPLEIIDRFGADALRFMLMNSSSPGNDMRYLDAKVESSRNFANKLWNASRFVIMNLGDDDGNLSSDLIDGLRSSSDLLDEPSLCLADEDRWILVRTGEAVRDITRNMEKYEFTLATQKIYELIWNEFCDWYIELVKDRLYAGTDDEKRAVRTVLTAVLSDLLRLLHPYMPFITEEIWSFLGKPNKLIADRWPEPAAEVSKEDADSAAEMDFVIDVIRCVRNIRAEAGAAPSRRLTLVARITGAGDDPGDAVGRVDYEAALRKQDKLVGKLAGVSSVTVITAADNAPGDAMSGLVRGVELFVPLDDLLDYAAERERLDKERERLEGEIKRLSGKLSNEGFVSKAPANVVDAERGKLAAAQDALEKVDARTDAIRGK
ncbi:MAG: valine--tRNA ligase, partial [Clostridiales Family XIII bacterium]|nr:valine--tRNA ligase [Clostridiales Family XIII bacterium]